ncbi:MAG: HAD family hydrolase [Alphaproteobacteria bacterium]|nr:HAD family hydrolase [Alphaproteobacteria bacterium]
MPLPRAVIFDWDNTLVDSWGAIAHAINVTRAHFGSPAWTMEEVKANCIRSARESFPDWYGDRWQEASDIFYGCFKNIQFDDLKPLRGSADLLKYLAAQKIPAFVVSNKNGEFLRREAEVLGWNGYFAAIIGALDAPRDKPAREHPDHALALGGLTASADIWFVGDSEADIACARNAGCLPVLIGNKESAGKYGVDMYVVDCGELLGLLCSPDGATK